MATFETVNLIHSFIPRIGPVWRAIIASYHCKYKIWLAEACEVFYSWPGMCLTFSYAKLVF